MAGEKPKERRRVSRVTLAKPIPARLRVATEAFIRNLSVAGALIESSRALAPGSSCEVHLELGGLSATAPAKVVRCHIVAGNASRYEAGLEFGELDGKTRSAIEKILKAAENGKPLPGTIRA